MERVMLVLIASWCALGEDVRAFSSKPLRKQSLGLGTSTVPAQEEFSLKSVRASLIRQEETIIFALIERAQFANNAAVYEPKACEFSEFVDAELASQRGERVSFLDVMLFETEQVHARARRYLSPEEHSFFVAKKTTTPVLPPLDYPPIINEDGENINDQVLSAYLSHVVPSACPAGDDTQHGSSAICDIQCLQALSRRIHFGKFVAESKFADNEADFRALAEKGDIEGIHAKLANLSVEDSVVRRAQLKAVTFGQDAFSEKGPGYKVDPEVIAELYRDMIIPLTKQVQVRYILHRLGMVDKIPENWPPYLSAFATDRSHDKKILAEANDY